MRKPNISKTLQSTDQIHIILCMTILMAYMIAKLLSSNAHTDIQITDTEVFCLLFDCIYD